MSKANDTAPSIFVWRHRSESFEDKCARARSWNHWSWTDDYSMTCFLCNEALTQKTETDLPQTDNSFSATELLRSCVLCGWWAKETIASSAEFGCGEWIEIAELASFNINDIELSLSELGSHLKLNYSDIYSLRPRRFEELVADVFKNQGFRVALTQETRDGGIDIFLLRPDGRSIVGIVECKRFALHRKVSISAVQRLAGVALQWHAERAYLVTSSNFSIDALKAGRAIAGSGYGLSLVGANELLNLMKVYNKQLPPLHLLDEKARGAIIEGNVNRKRN